MNRLVNKEKPFNPNDTLKTTSLFYIEEALDQEEYEICPELIQAAKDAGATRAEIQTLLTTYVKRVKGGNPPRGKAIPRF